MKTNTCREANPDSKRSKRRAKTGRRTSRCNRRAERRLGHRVGSYQDGCKADSVNGAIAFTAPGAQQRW